MFEINDYAQLVRLYGEPAPAGSSPRRFILSGLTCAVRDALLISEINADKDTTTRITQQLFDTGDIEPDRPKPRTFTRQGIADALDSILPANGYEGKDTYYIAGDIFLSRFGVPTQFECC